MGAVSQGVKPRSTINTIFGRVTALFGVFLLVLMNASGRSLVGFYLLECLPGCQTRLFWSYSGVSF